MTDMATSGGTALGQGGGGNEGEGKRMSGTGKPRKRTKTGCLSESHADQSKADI
jgi:hypothetical protein